MPAALGLQEFKMKNRVLVTGGAGFIGHHLVNKLINQGYTVCVVDDLSSSVVDVPEFFGYDISRTVPSGLLNHYFTQTDKKDPSIIFIAADFTNPSVLQSVEDGRFETVFHLAANPRVEWSVEKPIEATHENLVKTLKLAKSCATGSSRLVFSSTAAVYGQRDDGTTANKEFDQTNPSSPYGLSKLCAEKYLSLFGELYGLDWIALRYFNVYGERQPGDSAYSTVVSAWCHKALQGEPLRSDGDGTQKRDMIHVSDIVSANIFVSTVKDPKNTVFNVGTGRSISNNYIRSFFEERGYTKILHAPARKGDIKNSGSDISRLTALGWKPTTTFENGLNDVLNFWGL